MVYDYTSLDRAECAQLYVDVYANEPWGYSWMTDENVLSYFADIENTPRFCGFVAKKNDRTTAFCFGVISDYFIGSAYEIREFAVARAEQRRGTGGDLLANTETRLKRMGVQTLTLATLRTVPAFEFYLKNGFKLSEDTVYLNKNIAVAHWKKEP